jgi:hypothetical protein
MQPIPPAHKKIIDSDPYFRTCARNALFHDHICQGRITIEHAIIYAGRQIVEVWNYVPLCCWAHDVDEWQDKGNIDKRLNEFLAIRRASPEDLAKYPKKDWSRLYGHLKRKYEPLIKTDLSTVAPF